jgi:hypothetical protein
MARRSLLLVLQLLCLAVCVKTTTATATATASAYNGVAHPTAPVTSPCDVNEMTALTNDTSTVNNATIWSEERRQESALYESHGVTISTSNDTSIGVDNGNDNLLDYESVVSFGLFVACLVVVFVKFVRTHRREMADLESRNHDNLTVATASEWDVDRLNDMSVLPSQTNRRDRHRGRRHDDDDDDDDGSATSSIPTVITASMATTRTANTSDAESDEEHGDLDDPSVLFETIDLAAVSSNNSSNNSSSNNNNNNNDLHDAVNATLPKNDSWRGQGMNP